MISPSVQVELTHNFQMTLSHGTIFQIWQHNGDYGKDEQDWGRLWACHWEGNSRNMSASQSYFWNLNKVEFWCYYFFLYLLQIAGWQAPDEYVRVSFLARVVFCYCYLFIVHHFLNSLYIYYRTWSWHVRSLAQHFFKIIILLFWNPRRLGVG